MASTKHDDASRNGSADRRASLVVDPKLATEEDAAVLAKMGEIWIVARSGLLMLTFA